MMNPPTGFVEDVKLNDGEHQHVTVRWRCLNPSCPNFLLCMRPMPTSQRCSFVCCTGLAKRERVPQPDKAAPQMPAAHGGALSAGAVERLPQPDRAAAFLHIHISRGIRSAGHPCATCVQLGTPSCCNFLSLIQPVWVPNVLKHGSCLAAHPCNSTHFIDNVWWPQDAKSHSRAVMRLLRVLLDMPALRALQISAVHSYLDLTMYKLSGLDHFAFACEHLDVGDRLDVFRDLEDQDNSLKRPTIASVHLAAWVRSPSLLSVFLGRAPAASLSGTALCK